MNNFIYALVISIQTGIVPQNDLAMLTSSHQLKPAFTESLECQKTATTLNEHLTGRYIKGVGHEQAPDLAEHAGVFFGAWCIAVVPQKETK